MALHPGEFQIDEQTIRRLLAEQFPMWSDLPVDRLRSSGTVNVLYRLGDDKLLRLPRSSEFSPGPLREARLLPRFEGRLPLEISRHLGLGSPTEAYPSHWSVVSWIEGTAANQGTVGDLHVTANALADFVTTLRKVPTDALPDGGSYRAGSLSEVDEDLREWVNQLPEGIDRSRIIETWETCLAAGDHDGPPAWLHSDLRGDNLLAREGRLVAVIDWEGCTVGDPSADLLAAWWLFDADSRVSFREAVAASDPEWMRAKGWALHMAVAAIPYYSKTNPTFAGQAYQALDEIMSDSNS